VRPVAGVVAARHTLEGAGFGVFRPLPAPGLDLLDPFLLVDEMEPVDHAPGTAQGAPDHPHRGFETVTYLLEGEFEHRDSMGNHGTIGPGDIQWMTAGDGVVHSEMPSRRIQTEGGRVHGFQIWVNLPAADKRTTPRYQSLDADRLPTVEGDGWRARIVAGTMLGATGPAATHTPIGYGHVTLEPGAAVTIPVPADHNAGVYVFRGAATVGSPPTAVPERHLAVFGRDPGALVLSVPADATGPCDALVLTGRPLDEPVARYGPFVMNTREELVEAFDDFQEGRMGAIAATGHA
jgi:hypothetical protein